MALRGYSSAFYRRVFDRPLIHVIGDSHVRVFGADRLFAVYYMGAVTAHNLNKESSTTNSNRRLFWAIDRIRRLNKISHNEIVLLSFGEIDCRIHIYYQYKKNNERKTISELIGDTISNYAEVLEKLRRLGINFLVCSVPPATEQGNNFGYPFYASSGMRSQINSMFNERLKELCEKNGYGYIDVHSKFSDRNGLMLKEYALDEIHLNRNIVGFVKEQLKAQFTINI